jgi:AhpD family alkylhydroperoxidase
MANYLRYDLQTVLPKAAQGTTQALYAQMRADLGGVVEPLTLHSSAPMVLAGAWAVLRETLLAGNFDHGLKQAVAAAVSEINRCPWCVDAHSIVLYATKRGSAVEALTKHNLNVPLDDESRAILAWALATRTPNADVLKAPPFTPQQAPEVIGTAITFHYLNRMVNILLVERVLPKQQWISNPLKRVFGVLFAPQTRKYVTPGESLQFLPQAELPNDLSWTADAEHVAGAFAGFAAVIDEVERRLIPGVVREVAIERLQRWNGDDPGLSRAWVEEAVRSLDTTLKPMGKLVLLAIFAPHQVDERIIADFRAYCHGDTALVETVAWASFTAARNVGTWLSQ